MTIKLKMKKLLTLLKDNMVCCSSIFTSILLREISTTFFVTLSKVTEVLI